MLPFIYLLLCPFISEFSSSKEFDHFTQQPQVLARNKVKTVEIKVTKVRNISIGNIDERVFQLTYDTSGSLIQFKILLDDSTQYVVTRIYDSIGRVSQESELANVELTDKGTSFQKLTNTVRNYSYRVTGDTSWQLCNDDLTQYIYENKVLTQRKTTYLTRSVLPLNKLLSGNYEEMTERYFYTNKKLDSIQFLKINGQRVDTSFDYYINDKDFNQSYKRKNSRCILYNSEDIISKILDYNGCVFEYTLKNGGLRKKESMYFPNGGVVIFSYNYL